MSAEEMAVPNVLAPAAAVAELPDPQAAEAEIGGEIRKAARHSFVYGLGNVTVKALGFLMLPFYTHYLSPTDYGVLEILELVISLIGMFLHMGITAAMVRSYVTARSREDKRHVVSTAFLFVTGTAAVTSLVLVGFLKPISALILGPNVPATYLLLSFSAFIAGYITVVPRSYLFAQEASGVLTLIDTVPVFIMLALNIYFIAVLKLGIIGILLSSLLVFGIQMIVLSVWVLRSVGIGFNRRLMSEMAGFGLPLVSSNLALFTLNFADRLFLQRLVSLEVVGVYGIGYKFGFMLNYLLVQPFYIMWQARMYAVYAQPNHGVIFRQIFVLYSTVLIYVGLALSLFSPEVVRMMVDARFSASQEVIPVVALSYVLYGIGYYLQLGLFLKGRTGLVGVISAAAAISNLGLNYLLILYFGMMGAAWATLLSFGVIAAGSYFLGRKTLEFPLGTRRVATALALAVTVYLLARAAGPGAIVYAVAMKILVLSAFPLALWRMGVLGAGELTTIRSSLASARAAVWRLFPQSEGAQ